MTASESTNTKPLRELYPATLDCVHCGLCLSSCPTYLETGRETSSPRGRVYLMRGVAEGKIELGEVVAEEASLCLGCRACETACPSGVQYGALLEQTRAAVADAGLRSGFAYALERFALRHVVPNKPVLSALVSLLGLAQTLRLDALAAPLLPARLREMRALLPLVPPRSERKRLPAFTPALGTKRGRVALLEGCVMPELFGAVNAATVRVLARAGFDVLVPEQQSCCGALHAHSGDTEKARALARNNLAAFAPSDVDAVITNSAGCGAALRELEHWLPGEGGALASKTRDICEFLDAAGIPEPRTAIEGAACYDDPCHLAHGQRVVDAPRRLLAKIPGLRLIAHDDPASCCGAAGIYNLTQPEMSRAVLARKMDSLAAVNPDYIVTGNPGCLMQLAVGAKQRGLAARVVHPIELLDRALG